MKRLTNSIGRVLLFGLMGAAGGCASAALHWAFANRVSHLKWVVIGSSLIVVLFLECIPLVRRSRLLQHRAREFLLGLVLGIAPDGPFRGPAAGIMTGLFGIMVEIENYFEERLGLAATLRGWTTFFGGLFGFAPCALLSGICLEGILPLAWWLIAFFVSGAVGAAAGAYAGSRLGKRLYPPGHELGSWNSPRRP
jgi:hypothetical protein